MRKQIALLLAGLVLSWSSLKAEYDLEDIGSQNMTEAQQSYQSSIEADGDWIGKAKLKHDHDGRGHLLYNHENIEYNSVVWYNECYKEGINGTVFLSHTRFDWSENPFFGRTKYDTLSLGAAYFTHRLPEWRWIFQAKVNFDADIWEVSHYTTYDLLLWGRYHWCDTLGLHFGIYAETGMKLDRVYPILGVDWDFCDKWKLNAVFPLNISIVYLWNCNWSFSAGARFFSDRHRAGLHGEVPMAVWRYTNWGGELAVKYNLNSWLKLNIHAGYTLGGRFKIANKHSHHNKHYKLDSAPYAGGEFVFEF